MVNSMILNHHHITSPSEVLSTYLEVPLEYRQECINEIYSLSNTNKDFTNVKALRSTYHIWKESNVFDTLLKNIKIIIEQHFPSYDFRINKCEFLEAWSVIYKKGHFAISHHHSPFNISFVYYLQASNDTPLIFDHSNFSIFPKDDMLVIFPSYLYHSVPQHTKEKDRIVISGNLRWIFK